MVEQRHASTAKRIRLVLLALCFALLATACLPVAGSQEVTAGDDDLRQRELQLELDRLALENQRLAQELAAEGQQPVPTIPPVVQPTQPPATPPPPPPPTPTQPPQATSVPPTPVPPTPTPVPPTPTPTPIPPTPTPTPTPEPTITLTRLTIDRVTVIADCDGIEGAGDFRFTVNATITDSDGRNVSRRWYSGDEHKQVSDGGNWIWTNNIIEIRTSKGVSDVDITFTSVEADTDIFGNSWNDDRMVGSNSTSTGDHRGSLLGFGKTLYNGTGGCRTKLDYRIESLEL